MTSPCAGMIHIWQPILWFINWLSDSLWFTSRASPIIRSHRFLFRNTDLALSEIAAFATMVLGARFGDVHGYILPEMIHCAFGSL